MPEAHAAGRRTALLLCGGWEGHRPREAAALFRPALEAAGLAVDEALALDALLDAPRLARADLIVPCWTMGQLSDAAEAMLLAAVEAGCGLAGWHGGMADAFRDRPAYQFASGGQFVAHPGGMRRFRVEIAAAEHPITRGLTSFEVTGEQYYLHVDPALEVLVTTTFGPDPFPWIAGVRMPVAWTRRHGAGRVFCCTLGHSTEELAQPGPSELVRRGLLWAARRL